MLGKVYIIKSPHSEKVYIGSTIQTLQERFRYHTVCSNPTSSKIIIAMGDAVIELLEEVKVVDKGELRFIEQQYLELYQDSAVNRQYAFGLDKAKKKAQNAKYYANYSETNKARRAANFSEYYQKNIYKVPCVCGSIVTKISIPRHIKSLKHLKYIANNKENGQSTT